MTDILVKAAQNDCLMHGRCPHQDYCLDQHLCKQAQFPPVVRAETMLRESIRDGWIMGEHPVRWLRGNDHG